MTLHRIKPKIVRVS